MKGAGGTSGAILIGGLATRFGGRDKSRVPVDGRTILERQLDALRPCTDRVWLVGDRAIEPTDQAVEIVPDRIAGQGPLGGLDAALAAAAGDVLLLACDLPFVTGPMLTFMVSLGDGVDAVVPRTERGYHPLCAVYRSTCVAAVRRRLEHRQLRMIDLLDDLRVRTVGPAELAVFGNATHLLANVNTQADLDALASLSH